MASTRTDVDSEPREQEPSIPEGPRAARGTQPWWRRRGTLIALVVIALAFALPLRGLLRGQGAPMEEGFMLAFPERVLAGDVANKDFLHLYGPGSLWVLAGVYQIFGVELPVERLVGLAQMVGLVMGLFALARPWGRLLSTLVALVALFIIVPTSLVALAWIGALAFGVWAVFAAVKARGAPPSTKAARWWSVAAGLLAGAALLYRPDLIVATLGALLVVLWRIDRQRRNRFLAGLGIGLVPYIVHGLMAGPWTAIEGMFIDPVFYLRGGRRLPIPPSPDDLAGFLQRVGEFGLLDWPVPTLDTAEQNAIWFWLMFATVITLLAVGIRRLRQDPASLRARTVLAIGVFSIGLLPQGVQRVDSTHFAWATTVSLGFLPVALYELLGPRWLQRRPGLRAGLAGGVVLAVLIAVLPNYTVRRYADYVVQSTGNHRLFAYPVTWEGRTFYYGRRDVDEAMDELLPVVDRLTEPGDRLFVGPADLRRTPYSEAFLYYLFPELVPGTHYIEMDPGVADREGSGLDEDLASSDIAVLSRVWTNWDEPNDSRKIGSSDPVEVLEEQFCFFDSFGIRRDRSKFTSPTEGDPLFDLYLPRPEGEACPPPEG